MVDVLIDMKIGSKPKNKNQRDSIADYITIKQESASPDRSRKINKSCRKNTMETDEKMLNMPDETQV